MEREGEKDSLGGNNGGREKNDFRVFFAEVVGVEEEGDSEGFGDLGVVGARVGEDGVALADEGFGEELTEVAEADYGDFEGPAGVEVSGG